MSVTVSVQRAVSESSALPSDEQIQGWVGRAVTQAGRDALADVMLTVRIVEEEEIRRLNQAYRGKDYATNVLSFPFEAPPGLPPEALEPELGDVVICAAVVEREAREQHKGSAAHWAHMVIHGTLHLLGHDHESEPEAQVMEALETRVLRALGYGDPYAE
jgi:probable rRNA maturation factor